MSKFVLTAQLQLQAPTNTAQVVQQIQNQLQGVKVDIQVRNAQKAEAEIRGLSDSLVKADKSASKLGGTLRASIRRFTALAIATRAVSLFTNTLGKAVESAIDFERELIKISQVTGKTMSDLRGLTDEITRLSTSLGVSSSSILGVGRILSQAGLNARETQIALSTLAKTELAPTFDDITQTAEGAVAIFNQFKQGASSLEAQLGSLNAVAGQFAVEAGDLISVIRRTGGVFKQAGGDLNELIALFTSVRSTTRESAESIATGLRTIFTRIQRPETIKYLEQFGVKLLDLEGKFIGPYRAIGELNKALAGLEEGDITFIAIAEELGGFRQIGKVLPLIKEYAVAQAALKVAQEGSNSLAADAAAAQASLAVRIIKVKEEFLALIRSISETSTFQIMINGALNLASAFIKIADSIKPLLPLLGALAGINIAKGLAGTFGSFLGGGRKPSGFNKGGKVHAFATGGFVPGTGNSDTVPAMLTPGEFVMRKSAVQSIGASNLKAMNSGGNVQRYKKGTPKSGAKAKKTSNEPEYGLDQIVGQVALNESKATKAGIETSVFKTNLEKLSNSGSKDAAKRIKQGESPSTPVKVEGAVQSMRLGEESQQAFGSDDWIDEGLSLIDRRINEGLSSLNIGKSKSPLVKDEKARQSIEGYGLETFISGLSKTSASGGTESFDFRGKFNKTKLASLTVEGTPPDYFDAKRSLVARSKIVEKGINEEGINIIRNFANGGLVEKFALGGAAEQSNKKSRKRGFFFDFDDTLAVSGAKERPGEADPYVEFRGAKGRSFVESAEATRYAAMAKKRASEGYDVWVLTARPGDKDTVGGIKSFGAKNGISFKGVIGVGGMVGKGVDTASAKATILSRYGKLYDDGIVFADDAQENVLAASKVPGVKTVKAQKHLGGKIQRFAQGGQAKYSWAENKSFYDSANSKRTFYDVFEHSEKGAAKVVYRGSFDDVFKFLAKRREQQQAINTMMPQSKKFATGGIVPGTGNRDTVSATLQAGDFVIRKRSVESIGADNLYKMAGYAAGGNVDKSVSAMLTPGEFVFSKDQAQRVGYRKLNKMNKQGKYALGGEVQKFADGGPVNLYHGSNTGVNDSVLQSFKSEGAKSNIAQGYGQGAGFYVWSGKQKAKQQAEMRVNKGLGNFTVVSGDTKGSPMVVSFKEVLNPVTWDLDYEMNKGPVVQWLVNNFDAIKDKVAPKLTKDVKLAGIRDITRKNPSEGIMSDAIRVQTDTGSRTNIYAGTDTNLREGELVGQIMNRLQSQDPKAVYAFENEFFKSPSLARGEWDNLALKYVGTSPLKPVNIEVFGNTASAKSSNQITKKFATGGVISKLALGGIIQKFEDGSTGTGVAPVRNRMGMTPEQVAAAQERKRLRERQQGMQKKGPKLNKTFGLASLFGVSDDGPQDSILPETGAMVKIQRGVLSEKKAKVYENYMLKGFNKLSTTLSKRFTTDIRSKPLSQAEMDEASKKAGFYNAVGAIFEAALAMTGAPYAGRDSGKSAINQSIDFPSGLGSASKNFDLPSGIPTDATRTSGSRGKSKQDFLGQVERYLYKTGELQRPIKRAAGGIVPGVGNRDTVPATLQAGDFVIRKSSVNSIGAGNLQKMAGYNSGGKTTDVDALLTPGEFVFSRKQAQRIGYGKLNRMNKVGKYAKGGVVQRFVGGGVAERVPAATSTSAEGFIELSDLKANAELVSEEFEKSADKTSQNTDQVSKNTKASKEGLSTVQKVFAGMASVAFAMGQLRPNIDATSSAFATGTAAFVDAVTQMSTQAGTAAIALQKLGVRLDTTNLSNLFTGAGKTNINLGRLAGRQVGKVAQNVGFNPATAKAFSKNIAGAVTKLTPFIAGLTATIAVTGLLNSALTTFYNYQQRINKAIEEGDVKKAGDLAAGQASLESANNLRTAGAGIGSVVGTLIAPGIGTAIGAVIGGIAGTLVNGLASALSYLPIVGGFFSLAGDRARRLAEVQAGTIKATKSLEESMKEVNAEMQRFKDGNATISQVFDKLAPAANDTVNNLTKTDKLRDKGGFYSGNRKAGTGESILRGGARVVTLGLAGLAGLESGAQKNKRVLEQERAITGSEKQRDQFLSQAEPVVNTFARQVAYAGGSFEQFQQSLADNTDAGQNYLKIVKDMPGGMERLKEQFENIAKETEKTRKALEAMNLGFTSVNGMANATALSLNNYLNAQNAGYSGLSNSLSTLEASVTSAAQGISPEQFEASLGNASNVLAKFGATGDQIKKFEDNMRGVNALQRNLPTSFKNAQKALQDNVAKGLSGQASGKSKQESVIDSLVSDIESMNIGEDVKKSLTDQVKNIEFSEVELEQIDAGNFDILEKKLQEIGGKQLEQVKNAIQKQIEIQQKINETVQKRLDLEDKYVQAQQRAVDIIMEMKEGIAKFGGDAYTPEQKSADIVQSYNVQAQQAGLTGLGDGSPLELNRLTSEITSGLNRIANVRLAAGGAETGINGQRFTPEQQAAARQEMEGESGVNLEKQQARLNGMLEKQYNTTKALIDQKIQELNLIKEKNKLEKAAMDDLIAGDMEAFFDKMAAQGAQAAIATGDERLMGLYGGQALGMAAQENRRLQEAGVTELYGQKLGGPGGLTERGFQAVADRAGIADPTFAQAAAGTTVEEAAAEKEIRELYATLGPLADAMKQSASNDLEVGKQIEAAAKQLGGAAIVLHDAAVKLGGDPNAQPQQAGGGGSAPGGATSAGQAAVNQANVNAQTAVINVNNAEVSGGGGGGLMGAARGIYNSGGMAVVEAGNMARNAVNMGRNFASSDKAKKLVTQSGELLSDTGRGAKGLLQQGVDWLGSTSLGKKFAEGRYAQRAISANIPNVAKPQGLLGKAGGLFERINQASLGDDFNPNMLKRGKNLFNAGKNAVSGFMGNALNSFNIGKEGYDLAGLGYDTTKLSKTAKVSNFAGRMSRNISQSKLGQFGSGLLKSGKEMLGKLPGSGLLQTGREMLGKLPGSGLLQTGREMLGKLPGSGLLKTGGEMLGKLPGYVSGKAPGLMKGAMEMGKTGLGYVGSKLTEMGNFKIPGLDKIGPKISGALEFGLTKASKIPGLGKLAGGGAKMLGAGAKGIPGLGTALDAVMELGSFAYDPSGYNQDKKDKTSRDFGGMLESWGLGSLKTGITAVDGSLATLVGGLEGFLNPVGKIVEGAYNIVGGIQDTATLISSSFSLAKQEQKTSERMSETTRKRAEEAGYTGGTENYDQLSALEKSAAQAEANTLFRKGEAEKIAQSGGTAEDYRKSMDMDKKSFDELYGEGANIQDVIQQEQKFAETQKEERRAKARENRTYGEYFSGTDVEARSDTAVKEKLAINQAEARKRQEEAAAQQQAAPESVSQQTVSKQPAVFSGESVDKGIQNLEQLEKQSQKQEVQQYKQEEATSKQIKGAIPAASESVYKKEQAQQLGQPSLGIDPELLNKFSSALEKFNSDFSANIDRLENTKFKIELAPTNININLTGGNFLENMKDNIKEELLAEVARRMQNQGFNPDGSPRSTNGSQLG